MLTPNIARLITNQKVVSSSHISFNAVGLLALLLGGLLVTGVSLALEDLSRLVQRWIKSSLYSRMEWQTNGVLQMQRLVYEELGLGEWTRADEVVPSTAALIDLPPLDMSNAKHPVVQDPKKSIHTDSKAKENPKVSSECLSS
jgi:hypothetical protein